MRKLLCRALALLLTLAGAAACNSTTPDLSPAAAGVDAGSPVPPTADVMHELLMRELARLGIDPERSASRPPGPGSAIFDLRATLAPSGVNLTWHYHNVGDYDQSGEVDIADVSPLSTYWQRTIAYDDPATRGGVAIWPSGQPEDDGAAEPPAPPSKGSGAENWRMAQVDGDANGEINLAEITSLGRNYGVAINGYQIYRRLPGGEFAQLAFLPYPGGFDPSRPLQFTYLDTLSSDQLDDPFEYVVVPYEESSATEGPQSNVAIVGAEGGPAPPTLELAADQTGGEVPLTVNFTGPAATVDPSRTVVRFEWDFDGDGNYDLDSGTVPTASHTFTSSGTYVSRLRVLDSAGETAVAGLVIEAGTLPNAVITATPEGGEVPVEVMFDGRLSFSPQGDIARYEWDMDGNGVYELDRGAISTVTRSFTSPLAVTIGLRVTDRLGLQDTAQLPLEFADEYEEQEPGTTAGSASQMGLIEDAPVSWRGNIGNGGYNGDETDWYVFTIANGALADIVLTTSGPGVKLELALFDPDAITQIAILPQVTTTAALQRGLRGAGSYFLRVRNLNTPTGLNYDYTIDVDLSALAYDEVENNDFASTPNDLGIIGPSIVPGIWGNLGPGGTDGDSDDWYSFTLAQAEELALAMDFFHHEADLELALLSGNGAVLYSVSESVGDHERIQIELEPGTYLVHCYRREGGKANYELSIFRP